MPFDVTTQTRQRNICKAMRNAIIRKFGLTEASCFITASPVLNPVMGETTFQIYPGAEQPDGEGLGAQEGLGYRRHSTISIAVFRRLVTDFTQRNDALIIQAAEGMLDLSDRLEDLFDMTILGGWLLEPMEWQGTTDINIITPEQNVGFLRRDITWGCVYMRERSSTLTITEDDVKDL